MMKMRPGQRTRTWVLAMICAGMALVAGASSVAQPARAPVVVQLKPEEVVGGRRAAFYLSGAVFSDLGLAAKAGGEVKDLSFSADVLANWAKNLPHMFPEGSNVPPTHANPNIWTDRAGFEAKAAIYQAETTKLRDLAKANDRAGFLQQISVVKEACSGCHSVYHRRENTSDGK